MHKSALAHLKEEGLLLSLGMWPRAVDHVKCATSKSAVAETRLSTMGLSYVVDIYRLY